MDIQIDSKVFHEFQTKILPYFELPITTLRLIEEFVDIDVSADEVSKIVGRNQYLVHWLKIQVSSLGLKDVDLSLHAAISLIGMQNVRNLVAAMQLYRRIKKAHIQTSKEGKIEIKPTDYLKYSLKAEEFAQVRKLQYADTAYAAGFLFDVARLIGRDLYQAPKTFEQTVDDIFKHSLKTALIGVQIAKNLKHFSFSKFAFAGCLLHDLGKVIMDLLYPMGKDPNFQDFLATLSKKPMNRTAVHHLETLKFGFTHEYYTSRILSRSGVFAAIERAVLFHHEPYILKSQNTDLYQLAALITLATRMATNFRIPKDVKDPIFKSWLTPELEGFSIDPQFLLKTMHMVGAQAI